MHDIKPQYVSGANCFENSVITVANYYRGEYELLLADTYSLKISLEAESDKLSDKISFYDAGMLDKIERFYGIQIHECTDIKIEDIVNHLKSKKILLMEIDAYYCPQTVQYHKYHNMHACLAVANTANSVICIDVNIGTDNYAIPFDDIEQGIKKIYIFAPQNKYIRSNIVDEFKKSINNIINMDIPQNILCLKEALSNINLLKNEMLGYEKKYYTANPLILKLSQIGGRRSLYAKYLEFCTKWMNDERLNEVIELLLFSASKWYSWRASILISMFNDNLNNKIIEELQNKLKEIYLIEIEIKNKLKKIERRKITEKCNITNSIINNIDNQYTEAQMYFVNMDIHYNNRGHCISLYNEESGVGLTYNGDIFCDKSFETIKNIEADGIKYRISNQKNDNVSCLGQDIFIEKGNYQKLCILGCVENGNYFEYIKLLYCNSIEKKPIQLSNWMSSTPKFNNKLAITANAGNIYSKLIYKQKCSLFSSEIAINANEPLLKIVLPKCEHIHIFAITLIKK